MPDSDERFFVDVGDLDPYDRDEYELVRREGRARDREDAAGEACARHYPNPSATCPACGS